MNMINIEESFQKLAEWFWIFVALQNFSFTCILLSTSFMYMTAFWHKRCSKMKKSRIWISFINSDCNHSIIFSCLNFRSLWKFCSFLNAFKKRSYVCNNVIILLKKHLIMFSCNKYVDFIYSWLQDLRFEIEAVIKVKLKDLKSHIKLHDE